MDSEVKTVLFDLDGTLLPVDLDFFLKRYMEELSHYFKDLIPEEKMVESILKATYGMIGNKDPNLVNREAFARIFEPLVGLSWDFMWPKFLEFYEVGFPKLKRFVPESASARSVVSHCLDRGWDIVLATNPLFPQSAVEERMRWCNVHDLPWQLITTIDNMHFCKPHLEYYGEIADVLSLVPENCVMVGNDVQEDMCVKDLGMRAFLVEDFLIQRGRGPIIDGKGSLMDVPSGLDAIFCEGGRS